MPKEIFCAFGVDVDAVAGWLGSYGGEDSPCDITRGLFAGEVGSPRLLRLFERFGIKTTWFVPGHSAETFPEQMRAVADAGHEIGMHGYSHENPVALTPEQEEKIFDRCIEVMTLESKAELPEIVPSRAAGGLPARSWSQSTPPPWDRSIGPPPAAPLTRLHPSAARCAASSSGLAPALPCRWSASPSRPSSL